MIPSAITPTTDPPPPDLSHWSIGQPIVGTRLSQAYENGMLRPDVVIYTGTCKRAIRRVQQAFIDCWFTKHRSLIVNGVLMANVEGQWQDITLVNLTTVHTVTQTPKTKQMF